MEDARRVINGTWGELWLDGELVSECYKMQAKGNFNKQEISLCGRMAVDTKITSVKYTGSMGLHKVSSRMARKIGDKIKRGQDPRFTGISKLADPDAYGAERISIKNISFDDLTLADWEAAVNGKIEAPFTFTDFDFLDVIEET